MEFSSLNVKKYKLFEDVELEDLRQVNVIIGKNNSGKSSLIDVVAAAYDSKEYKKNKIQVGDIVGKAIITEEMVKAAFGGYSGIGRWNEKNYSKEVVGKNIEFNILLGSSTYGNALKVEVNSSDSVIKELKSHWSNGLRDIENSINSTCFRRMSAERNIVPESSVLEGLSETGEGASNLIRKIILESTFDENLIEDKLLDALNFIMYPDAEFESIRIQQISKENEEMWEIFLQEKDRQRIPLSKMGSGLKTIILILLNLLVIPFFEKKKKFVYAFEEVENNLHPALQRRIFDYLYNYAINENATIFLTTHSHVAINCFYDKEQASIYHIEKIDGNATVKRIDSYIDKAELLSDLDVKASDILQANGIIWVEGPSDRIYIKRWLELFTGNQYVEGKHYQFLYYGGKLLSQYAAKETTDLISILTTNRNAAIVIDSDKKNQQASINSTKKRIVEEFSDLKMFSWVTKGKEIENYIPCKAIMEMIQIPKLKQCGQYELFPKYIDKYYSGFTGKKVLFANEIVPYFTIENCETILDIKQKILKLYKQISSWNE